MNKLLILLSLLSTPSFSYDFLQPKSLGLELEYFETLRDPYVPEDQDKWTYGAAMNTKISVLGSNDNRYRLYFDPELRFRSTTSQIRYGALYFATGLEINTEDRCYRVFRRHLSEHVLERDRPARAYPLLDSYVISMEWRIK
jgi:hypothetical protein